MEWCLLKAPLKKSTPYLKLFQELQPHLLTAVYYLVIDLSGHQMNQAPDEALQEGERRRLSFVRFDRHDPLPVLLSLDSNAVL